MNTFGNLIKRNTIIESQLAHGLEITKLALTLRMLSGRVVTRALLHDKHLFCDSPSFHLWASRPTLDRRGFYKHVA